MKYIFNPTILFYGRCEQALNFYTRCLGGEIPFLSRFKDSGIEHPAQYKDKIMHAEFRSGTIFFMASDGMPEDIGKEPAAGMMGLSLNFESVAEQAQLFEAMSVGGKVLMPLKKMFWGAQFGTFVDAFGVRWEFNCQLEGATQ